MAKAPKGDEWLHKIKYDGYRPENEITADRADKWAVYSYKRDFYFCVDADGTVIGGKDNFDKMLAQLKSKKQKAK